jgi:transposase
VIGERADPHVYDEARDRAHAQHLAEPARPVRVAAGSSTGWPPFWPRQQLIDGLRFRVRTGALWRDVPGGYRPWNGTATWTADGSGTAPRSSPHPAPGLADAKGSIVCGLSVDSTVGPRSSACGQARKQGELQKEPPRAY